MIQRVIVLIFIFFLMIFTPISRQRDIYSAFMPVAYAADSLKINSINFDNSDSIIFLGTSGSDDLAEVNIKKQVLTDPDRIFFDIENAVTTFPNKSYELKNSKLKQVKIAQNSTAPDVVRIVIMSAADYDSSQIKVLKIKNNIIIKLNNEKPIQQYLTQIYKETKESAIEYFEKAVAISQEKPAESDEIFNKVQQAFKDDSQELVRPNIEQKQARLKSRFFLDKVSPRSGNVLISGIGVVNIEKPFTLTEPSRVVFDLPNTIVLQELRDKEFRLSETESVKIGQFEPSKARIVIKTNNPDAYRPIYSTNLQTVLIANSNNITGVSISPIRAQLTYFKEQNINERTDVINITFSNPIVYSIKRTTDKMNIIFYNLSNFDIDTFNSLAAKNKNGYVAKQLGASVYAITFPIGVNVLVDGYEALNASQLRFVFTKKQDVQTVIEPSRQPKTYPEIKLDVQQPKKAEPAKKQEIKKESPFANLMDRQKKKNKNKNALPPEIEKIKGKVIVIDPGHGGNDTGALRNGILEKDLTLQIALKVRDILRERGLQYIIMTRTSDTTLTLDDRVQTSNNSHADIFVSIHINASVKSEIKGIETHYYTENGYEVAKVLHKELMENIDAMDRGLFKSKFYVINHTEAPAVLLELGFISNESERNALTSEKRQDDSARAIADGIIKYLSEH